MSRNRAFFVEEAEECLRAARAELGRGTPDPAVLHRSIRRLRGSAELARLSGISNRAGVLEERLREARTSGWSSDLREASEGAIRWLEGSLEEVRSGKSQPETEGNGQMDGEVRADGVVGIEELEYRGNAALERAAELRAPIEAAIVTGATAEPLLDELFDLIRLGMK